MSQRRKIIHLLEGIDNSLRLRVHRALGVLLDELEGNEMYDEVQQIVTQVEKVYSSWQDVKRKIEEQGEKEK